MIDQASKLWLLYVFDLAQRGAVRVTPFFDLVLAWNVGISFGWFQTDNQLAQVALMAIKAVAVIVLGIWMARSSTLLATLALGLIIGGAVGNGIDRFPAWRGGRFRPVPHRDRGKNLQLVRV